MDAPLGPDAGSRFQKIDKVVLLAQCPLFSGLSQWELRSISQLMRLVEYKKDEIVYDEGGEGEGFYVIVSGRLEAYVTSAGKKRVLAYLRRGDYFGEMSLLTDQPHSATIHALSDSLVLEIKKEGFKKSIAHNATLSLELSRRLSSRLKVTESRSRTLFKSDVLSIYGGLSRSQKEQFSVNLAACLMAETHQRTVLLDLASSASDADASAGAPGRLPLKDLQNAESWTSEDLKKVLTRHAGGFDCLYASYDPGDTAALDAMVSLLNLMAVDYRFILVDLSADLDELDLRAVSQSDALFVVTDSHLNSMTEAREAIREIERTLSFPEDKISIVVQEVVFGAHTTASLRKEMFGKKRYFSLPLPPAGHGSDSASALVTDLPDTEYSRMVRHMARYLSGNLVGLALGSGAALGLAHIGVLKALEREKIPVDIIAGSSIGALIGSLYAVGLSAAEIEKAATEINLRVLFGRLIDISLFPIRGLLHGKQVMRHFRKHLGNKTFDQCRIPLKITGANLTTRQSLVFESGSVAEAVRTSIAIPAIIKPVITNAGVIVDGGILNPLPIRALQQAGANKVIAVNVFPTSKDMQERRLMREEAEEKDRSQANERGFFAKGLHWIGRSIGRAFSPNLFDILMNTIQAMEAEIAEVEGEGADVLIRPVMPMASWVDFYKPEPFIRRGEEEAMKMLPKIKALVSQQNV
jgi:NTE family protein